MTSPAVAVFNVLAVAPGFEAASVLSARLTLPPGRFTTRESIVVFQRALTKRVASLPQVLGMGAINLPPLIGRLSRVPFTVEGRVTEREQVPLAQFRIVSPGYFEAMGIHYLSAGPCRRRRAGGGEHVLDDAYERGSDGRFDSVHAGTAARRSRCGRVAGPTFVAVGLTLGLALAAGLGRLLPSLLFGIAPADPATLLQVAGTVAAAASIACALPTVRALRVDAMLLKPE